MEVEDDLYQWMKGSNELDFMIWMVFMEIENPCNSMSKVANFLWGKYPGFYIKSVQSFIKCVLKNSFLVFSGDEHVPNFPHTHLTYLMHSKPGNSRIAQSHQSWQLPPLPKYIHISGYFSAAGGGQHQNGSGGPGVCFYDMLNWVCMCFFTTECQSICYTQRSLYGNLNILGFHIGKMSAWVQYMAWDSIKMDHSGYLFSHGTYTYQIRWCWVHSFYFWP